MICNLQLRKSCVSLLYLTFGKLKIPPLATRVLGHFVSSVFSSMIWKIIFFFKCYTDKNLVWFSSRNFSLYRHMKDYCECEHLFTIDMRKWRYLSNRKIVVDLQWLFIQCVLLYSKIGCKSEIVKSISAPMFLFPSSKNPYNKNTTWNVHLIFIFIHF